MTADITLARSTTRAEAVRHLTGAFARNGIDTPALDARVLVAHALGIEKSELLLDPCRSLCDAAPRVAASAHRRLGGEPVARILGRREFWGLEFRLSPATLVPRPESETLVEAVLARCRQGRLIGKELTLVDLGTGSGCLLVALLSELPQAWGLGIDRSQEALITARRNAVAHGVGDRAAFAACDWAAGVAGGFDVVVGNPPYVKTSDIVTLAREVAGHDPRLALDGGSDGLAAFGAIAQSLPRLISAGGFAALEVGAGQAEAVSAIIRAAGLARMEIVYDLSGKERVVVATR